MSLKVKLVDLLVLLIFFDSVLRIKTKKTAQKLYNINFCNGFLFKII